MWGGGGSVSLGDRLYARMGVCLRNCLPEPNILTCSSALENFEDKINQKYCAIYCLKKGTHDDGFHSKHEFCLVTLEQI